MMIRDCDKEEASGLNAPKNGGKTAYYEMLIDSGYSRKEAAREVIRRDEELMSSKVCVGGRSIRTTIPAELIDRNVGKGGVPSLLWKCGINTKYANFEKHFGFYTIGMEGIGGRRLGSFYVGEERLDREWINYKSRNGKYIASYEARDLANSKGFNLRDIRTHISRKPSAGQD